MSVLSEWIEALESGEYEQTVGALCRDTEGGHAYCCLGVLCEVKGARRARLDKGTSRYGAAFGYTAKGHPLQSGSIDSDLLAKWLDVPRTVAADILSGSYGSRPLPGVVALNDVKNADFGTIATFLRENYLDKVEQEG